ncbi:MAG: hypothetical protein ACR2P3_01195 [Geminicoccaceae bacterium]
MTALAGEVIDIRINADLITLLAAADSADPCESGRRAQQFRSGMSLNDTLELVGWAEKEPTNRKAFW